MADTNPQNADQPAVLNPTVVAMRSITEVVRSLCRDLIHTHDKLTDHQREHLLGWSENFNAEALCEWIASEGDEVVIGAKEAELVKVAAEIAPQGGKAKATKAAVVLLPFRNADFPELARMNAENAASFRQLLHLVVTRRLSVEYRKVERTRPLSLRSIATTKDGDSYVGLGKMIPAMSWVLNGNAVKAPHLYSSDGDKYMAEPMSKGVIYVSRAWELLPKAAKGRAYNKTLPFVRNDECSLMMVGVDSATRVWGPTAGKLLCTLFPAAPLDGGITGTTLENLAREIMPKAKRIQARDYREILVALRGLRELLLKLDDETDANLFSIAAPWNVDRPSGSSEVSWAFSAHTLAALKGNLLKGSMRTYNGWFLINHSRLMQLDGRSARAISFYLRIAAHWNAAKNAQGEFDASRLHPINLEEFLASCDTLSPSTVEYLKEGGKYNKAGSASRAQDQKAGRGHLEALRELGLIQSWEVPGDPLSIRYLPTERDLEAMRIAAKLSYQSGDGDGAAPPQIAPVT